MTRTPRQAAKDLALYLAITAAILIPVVASLLSDWHPMAVAKGVFACFFTGIIFGPFLWATRKHWRQSRFWYGSFALFAMHCGVLVYLSKQQHISAWLLVPISVIEGGTLNMWAADLAKPRRSHL